VQLAEGRVRFALVYARDFARQSSSAQPGEDARVTAAQESADRWLEEGAGVPITAEDERRLLGELREPLMGSRAIDASKTLLIALDLDHLLLTQTTFRGSTVACVSARHARLELADATGARIVRCSFEGAAMRLSAFNDAKLEECDFTRANLEGTTWKHARVRRLTAIGAVFWDAHLEGASFVDCDLRDADFQALQGASSVGLEFVRCDLRGTIWSERDLAGASFIGCRMYGIRGRATGLEHAAIEEADLSPDARGARLSAHAEVVDSWRRDDWTEEREPGGIR
jgi:uncharacterized protein YjbI with pentapeptide repeats